MVLVQNLSKLYKLYRRPSDRLREALPFGPRKLHSDFWALRDISFQVEKGETLGLVGPNGCGKSTLLQLVCGILQPTLGRVVTRGRIAALLELGAGCRSDRDHARPPGTRSSVTSISMAGAWAAQPQCRMPGGLPGRVQTGTVPTAHGKKG